MCACLPAVRPYRTQSTHGTKTRKTQLTEWSAAVVPLHEVQQYKVGQHRNVARPVVFFFFLLVRSPNKKYSNKSEIFLCMYGMHLL